MHASSETHSVADIVRSSSPSDVLQAITECLDSYKAEDITAIDLGGKSSIADHMVVASGRSQRQVASLTDYLLKCLKDHGVRDIIVQGLEQADWVLVDAGDIVVHLFRPEVRSFYNLDKMWGADVVEEEALN